jgi:LysM repeat protein
MVPPAHRTRRARLVATVVGALAVTVLAATALSAGDGAGDAAYAATVTVTIQPGDTLTSIAARYHTTVAALVAANGITDPNRIYVGATLQIPGAAAPPPVVAASSAPTSTVVVQAGDTLSSIAARYQTTVAALVAANHITDPNVVDAGARLVVPSPGLPPGWGPGGPLPPALLQHPDRLALRPDFLAAAGQSGMAPSLLEAMCWWESGWQSGVTSSSGAVGLCQLEPSTVTYVRTVLLHDPALDPRAAADNIEMAAAYLANLTARAGGNTRTALAGYYQGLPSVLQSGMLPSTKTYVAGITNYAAAFAAAG